MLFKEMKRFDRKGNLLHRFICRPQNRKWQVLCGPLPGMLAQRLHWFLGANIPATGPVSPIDPNKVQAFSDGV